MHQQGPLPLPVFSRNSTILSSFEGSFRNISFDARFAPCGRRDAVVEFLVLITVHRSTH